MPTKKKPSRGKSQGKGKKSKKSSGASQRSDDNMS
jgi:hypothetical protein